MSQIDQAVVLKAYEDEDLPRIEWDEKEPGILEVYIRLELEKKILWFTEGATKEQLIRHCEAIERQHFHQSQFIANCLKEIARCKAKIACLKNPVKQPTFKNWLRKVFYL